MTHAKWTKMGLHVMSFQACINPIGAQDTGCRFDKKPMFRYSGCHRYDVSAFNIVLGEVFSFKESAYMGSEAFFRKVDQYAGDRVSATSNSTSSSRIPSSAESMDNLEMR